MAQITLEGNPIHTSGELPAVNTVAPDFRLVAGDLSDKTLDDFAGKKKLLNIVVSLDTGICIDSSKLFYDKLAGRDDVAVIAISADLPFAQARTCEAANSDVTTLSMMRSKNFAKDYGVLMVDGPMAGLCARSVLVLDTDNTVLYAEQVPEIAQEPDYDAAIAALG
jgi:thiol peroxidase